MNVGQNIPGCFVQGGRNGMGCYVWGDKPAWDVLSGMANLCGMFCPGCQKNGMGCFVPGCFVRLPISDKKIFKSYLQNLFLACVT